MFTQSTSNTQRLPFSNLLIWNSYISTALAGLNLNINTVTPSELMQLKPNQLDLLVHLACGFQNFDLANLIIWANTIDYFSDDFNNLTFELVTGNNARSTEILGELKKRSFIACRGDAFSKKHYS